jgi:ABC-type nitrate/sulfonate/bicarbonate transport system substrate-binding protein
MKHILTAIIIVLIAALAAVLIIPMVQNAQPVNVAIAVERSLAATPISYAEQSGIFADNNVKVNATVTIMDNPTQAFDDLAAGKIQFALMPWPEALRWMNEHPKDTLRCFLSEEFKVGSPQDGIFAKKGLSIKSITDLEGKKIGVSTLTALPMRAIIGSAQLDTTKMIFKVYNPDQLIPALEKGDVDLIYVIEPYMTMAIAKFGNPFEDGASMPKWIKTPYWGSGLFTTSKYFSKNREAVIRVGKAMDLTFSGIGKNSDSARIFVSKTLGINDSMITWNMNLPEIVRTQEMDAATIQDLSDKFEIYGVMKSINITERNVLIPKGDLRD